MIAMNGIAANSISNVWMKLLINIIYARFLDAYDCCIIYMGLLQRK